VRIDCWGLLLLEIEPAPSVSRELSFARSTSAANGGGGQNGHKLDARNATGRYFPRSRTAFATSH
jgi:hypothetical protein